MLHSVQWTLLLCCIAAQMHLSMGASLEQKWTAAVGKGYSFRRMSKPIPSEVQQL